jgi:hypothetical protein
MTEKVVIGSKAKLLTYIYICRYPEPKIDSPVGGRKGGAVHRMDLC